MGADSRACTAASTCDPARATPAGTAPRATTRTSRYAARRRIVALSGARVIRGVQRVGDGGGADRPRVVGERAGLRLARLERLARRVPVADHRGELLAVLHQQAGRAGEQGQTGRALLARATGRAALLAPRPRQQAPHLLGRLRGGGLLWPAAPARHGRAPRRRGAPPASRPLGGLAGAPAEPAGRGAVRCLGACGHWGPPLV